MFKASRKAAYDEVLPLPRLEDVADRVRRGRVLLIVSPDSKIPPAEVQKFFDGLSQKNNLCVLTGDKTAMASVEKAARQLYAAQKADGRIPKGLPQRDDLERKQQTYEQDFNATVLNLFDKLLFPIQRGGRPAQLANEPPDMTVPGKPSIRPFVADLCRPDFALPEAAGSYWARNRQRELACLLWTSLRPGVAPAVDGTRGSSTLQRLCRDFTR